MYHNRNVTILELNNKNRKQTHHIRVCFLFLVDLRFAAICFLRAMVPVSENPYRISYSCRYRGVGRAAEIVGL